MGRFVVGGQQGSIIRRGRFLPEVLAADVLEDGQAEGVEQEVPGLVLLLDEAAGCQAERVAHRPPQQQDVQLREVARVPGTLGKCEKAWGGRGQGRERGGEELLGNCLVGC